jgi:hypothetical protein
VYRRSMNPWRFLIALMVAALMYLGGLALAPNIAGLPLMVGALLVPFAPLFSSSAQVRRAHEGPP